MKYLSKAEKEFYNTNGFIKLENLLSESEVEEASNAYSDLFHVSFTTALQMENVHNVKWLYFIWPGMAKDENTVIPLNSEL